MPEVDLSKKWVFIAGQNVNLPAPWRYLCTQHSDSWWNYADGIVAVNYVEYIEIRRMDDESFLTEIRVDEDFQEGDEASILVAIDRVFSVILSQHVWIATVDDGSNYFVRDDGSEVVEDDWGERGVVWMVVEAGRDDDPGCEPFETAQEAMRWLDIHHPESMKWPDNGRVKGRGTADEIRQLRDWVRGLGFVLTAEDEARWEKWIAEREVG